MKRFLLILLVAIIGANGFAQQTYPFVERDTTLHLDIYRPSVSNGYTIIHIFYIF